MQRDQFFARVKRNCDISDARYWGYYSICGLLMRLRELYLSEHGLQPWDSVVHDDLTRWISIRETLWETLESEVPGSLPVDGSLLDPFAQDEINRHLHPHGLYYGSGIGILGKPAFFIGDRASSRSSFGCDVTIIEREHCRDLSLFPAMLRDGTICIRREAVKTFLWERIQSFLARSHLLPQDEVFGRYGILHGTPLPENLPDVIHRIMDDTEDLFVLHETGEASVGKAHPGWKDFLCSVSDKGCDLYLRGLKDILADTSDKGPLRRIVEDRNDRLLSFYVVFLDGIRKELFPGFMNAFKRFREAGDWSCIEEARRSAYETAFRLTELLLHRYRTSSPPKEIVGLIRQTLGRR